VVLLPLPPRDALNSSRPTSTAALLWLRGLLATLTAIGVVAAGGIAPACSTSPQTSSVDASFDAIVVESPPDAVAGADVAAGKGVADAAGLQTGVRLALMSPLPFGVDVCLGANQRLQGPLVYLSKQLPTLPDAGRDAPRHPASDASTDARPDTRDATPDAAADGGDAAVRSDATLDGDATARDASPHPHDGAVGDAETDAGKDGGVRAGGVLQWTVSDPLTVQGAGNFSVRIVVGGSSSCSTGVLPMASETVTLAPGEFATFVVLAVPPAGDAGADAAANDAAPTDAERPRDASRADARPVDASAIALPTVKVIKLVDEPLSAELASTLTLAHARFFNATTFAPDAGTVSPLGVVAVAQNGTVPLADDVPMDGVSATHAANPAVDSLGYWAGPPLSSTAPIDLRVGAPVPTDASVEGGTVAPSWTFAPSSTGSFGLVARSNHTGFLVGGGVGPPNLVWCDDTCVGVDAAVCGSAAVTQCVLVTPE